VNIARLFVVIAVLLATSLSARAGAFLGPIPVQYVGPNEELVLDMHRFYQPDSKHKLEARSSDDVSVRWDEAAFQLHVTAKKKGIIDIPITAGSKDSALKTVLTLASFAGTNAHTFTFKPSGSAPSKVAVAGAFNGWSMDKNPLTPGAAGEWTASVPLKPGRYGYKFVVDGKWTIDPGNTETEDNGLGDKNSVLNIAGESQGVAPVIYADSRQGSKLIVRAANLVGKIVRASAVIETDKTANSTTARIKGDTIEVDLPENSSGFVRIVCANDAGVPTNVVRAAFDSSPAGFHWQDAVLYYAFTDRFSDGDTSNDHPVDDPHVAPQANYHGGDLRGITQKIDDGYFEKLGVNTIWVAPLNRNPATAYQESPEPHRWYTGYHGYWPVSSTEIDPHIGTPKDLSELVDHAHGRGMKVIADLVLHHVHQEHPWWKEHRDWFGTLDLPDGRKNLRLWDEQQFTTWFEPYLPSFDFSKDAPVHALIDNSIWWANTYKLDGFRLDAVKHILPSFWWKFRAALRDGVKRPANSPLYLVGETFKDREGIMSFVGPNMLDGQFDFPLYDQIKDTFGMNSGDLTALDDALVASEKIYGKETLMSPLVGNHDKGRFMAYADGELPGKSGEKDEEIGWKNPPTVHDPANYGKLELAQAFLMSIDGVPMIYYGDEIGMTGAGDPDNRRDMRFGNKISGDENSVLSNFAKLGEIRRDHPALRYGSRRMLVADHDQYAFVRAHFADRVLAAFNRSATEATLDLQVAPEMADGEYVNALSDQKVQVKDGVMHLSMAGRSAAIVIRPPVKTD
jgi:cyclomaltodextrinase